MNRNKKFFKMGRDSVNKSLSYVQQILLNKGSESELTSFNNGKVVGLRRNYEN